MNDLLRAPSSFSFERHYEKQVEARQLESTTLYGSAWSPAYHDGGHNGEGKTSNMRNSDRRFFVACSSFGMVYIWDVHKYLYDDEGDLHEEEHQQFVTQTKRRQREQDVPDEPNVLHDPVMKFEVMGSNRGNLFNLEFNKVQGKDIMVLCGDAGVLVYDWNKQILPRLLSTLRLSGTGADTDVDVSPRGDNMTKTAMFRSIPPVMIFQPHPSILEPDGVEINCTACDERNGWLYGAAGDLFGCYQWDLETMVLRQTLSGGDAATASGPVVSSRNSGTLSARSSSFLSQRRSIHQGKKHTDYLHTVKTVKGQNTVLTGGEDGKLGFWDGKEGKLVDMMDCLTCTNHGTSGMRSDYDSLIQAPVVDHDEVPSWKWEKTNHLWVSSMAVDVGGNWATVCGGVDNPNKNSSNIRLRHGTFASATLNKGNVISKGFITLWNIPTRTLISSCATKGFVQNVAFCEDAFDRIATIGNEPVVSFWSRSSTTLQRRERAWASCPSGYTLSVHPDLGILTSAGASKIVDCFTDVGNKAFSMNIR